MNGIFKIIFKLFLLLARVVVNRTKNNDYNGDVVDLGLPSGVKWATCNLGAENPWNYGHYYAWGEKKAKDYYNWKNYKYCKGTARSFIKYCNKAEWGNGGFTDTRITLEPTDDVATTLLGSYYSMPTDADWDELERQCYWVWTETYNNHNVCGYIIYKVKSTYDKGRQVYYKDTPSASYSLKDPHIFLPAAGFRDDKHQYGAGSDGLYWSATLGAFDPFDACGCNFNGGVVNSWDNDAYRCYGQSVRPVRRLTKIQKHQYHQYYE